MTSNPRDRVLTVYGRIPVREALEDPHVDVVRVIVARSVDRSAVRQLHALAEARQAEWVRVDDDVLHRISKNARQDQGVAADVAAPELTTVAAWRERFSAQGPRALRTGQVLALDHVTTPRNVGMAIRSAVAFGLDGVVLPSRGVPEIGPLVIKASAGTALRAPILRCESLAEGLEVLRRTGFQVVGLMGEGTEPLATARFPSRVVFVVGNESRGISDDVLPLLHRRVRIDLAPGVDSLNVACAVAVLGYAVRPMAAAGS